MSVFLGIIATVSGPIPSASAQGAGEDPVEANGAWLDTETSERIDAVVQKALREEKLSGGFTLAVVKSGKTVLNRAYGYADRETKRPMTTDAIFPIGSITKTFTAAIAVKLAARGTIELNESVDQYLPAGVRLNPSLTKVPVTLTTLMTHRAGWPRDNLTRRNLRLHLPSNFDPSIADPASFTKQEFYRGLSLSEPVGVPLIERHYSNMGFHFAAHVLELASGRRMEQLVTDEVAKPIGMLDTTFYPSALQKARIPTGYAFDERNERPMRVPAWSAGEIVGGAFLNSTAESLARFAALFADKVATVKFLGGDDWDDILFRPYIEFIEGDSWRAQALAWEISVFGPYGAIMRKSGDSDGHNAFVALSRSRRFAVVLLTNNDFGANEDVGNKLLLTLLQHDNELDERARKSN